MNRLDDIIIFDILSKDAIKQIVSIQIEEVTKRLEQKNIDIKVTPTVVTYLGNEGYDPHYGARPLKRLIQTKILDPLAQLIIKKQINDGESVKIDIKKDEFIFDVKKGKEVKSITTTTAMEEFVV